jgi:hypothetical protein
MSFTDYLGTLGAKRVPIGYSADQNSRRFIPAGLKDNQGGDATVTATKQVNYGLGDQIGGLNRSQQSLFNERGFAGANASEGGVQGRVYNAPQTYTTHYSNNPTFTSGYVDSSGGFLGYGSSLSDLQNNNALNNQYQEHLINEPARLANLESQRIANEQAAFNLQRSREARRAAESNNPQFTGSGLVGMGQQGMQQPQQMAPQQFGRSAVPGMGRGTGQGIGRGTGQGLLGGLHRGAAPTGGGQ